MPSEIHVHSLQKELQKRERDQDHDTTSLVYSCSKYDNGQQKLIRCSNWV